MMIKSAQKLKQNETLSDTDETERKVSALINLVGGRVRQARTDAGYSRRELSELSGLSQRYLVQLENGEGNISIGLLKRIALAFNESVESFLVDDDELSVEAAQIIELYRTADAHTRNRVKQLLSPDQRRAKKAQRICLLGLRGAGKSTLGELISKKLECKFVELNDEIERKAGMPVSEIIALYGQEGYRELEATCLNDVIETQERIILAVAGGVVSHKHTFETLLSRFNTVWIKATPDEHMSRVRAQGDVRPMADNPQAMMQLRQILKNREAKYKLADFELDTATKSLDQSLIELSELISVEELLLP